MRLRERLTRGPLLFLHEYCNLIDHCSDVRAIRLLPLRYLPTSHACLMQGHARSGAGSQ